MFWMLARTQSGISEASTTSPYSSQTASGSDKRAHPAGGAHVVGGGDVLLDEGVDLRVRGALGQVGASAALPEEKMTPDLP